MDYFEVRLKSVEENYPTIFKVYSEFELRCEVCQQFGKHDCVPSDTAVSKNKNNTNSKVDDGAKPKQKRKRKKKSKKNGILTTVSNQETVSGNTNNNMNSTVKRNVRETIKGTNQPSKKISDEQKTINLPVSNLTKQEGFKIILDFVSKINVNDVVVLIHKLQDLKEPRDRLDALCQHTNSIDELHKYKPPHTS